MIRWVFFDVGNVLFNDAPQDFEAFRFFHRAIRQKDVDCTFDRFLIEREELARTNGSLILGKLAARWLDAERIREVYRQARQYLFSRYDEYNLVNEDVRETLARLGEEYRLGIIANQPVECRASLRRRKLEGAFEVIALSEEIGLHKPGVEIFQWAMDRAGASPAESVMVGDRLDNDIVPAAGLGMRTVWLRWRGHADKNWFPDDPEARAFLASTDRVPYYGAGPAEGATCDETVGNLSQVLDAVLAIQRRS